MNALILDGALPGDPAVPQLAGCVQRALAATGWNSEVIALRDQRIAYCLGCFECWTKTPGLCKIDDDGRTVTAAMLASDLVVYLTPLTFGGYSSELKKALDRSICLVSPFFMRIDGEVHHRPRYERYPAILGVGMRQVSNATQEQLFARLIERNAINLHAPAQAAVIIDANADAATVAVTVSEGLARLDLNLEVLT